MNELELLERYRSDVRPANPDVVDAARSMLDDLIAAGSPAVGGRAPLLLPHRAAPRSSRARLGIRFAVAFTLVVALVVAAVLAIDREVDRRVAAIPTVHLGAGALTPGGTIGKGPVNVLVVGRDSRAYEADAGEFVGERADTMILVRVTRHGVRSMWIPREIAVTNSVGATMNLGAALTRGPSALVDAVSATLGVPVHHYVSFDFGGFAALVDAVGGVKVRTSVPIRDGFSGLDLPAGCVHLDGPTAVALARSRYTEAFVDGRWSFVGQAAPFLARITNQQVLVEALVARARTEVRTPGAALRVLDGITSGVTVDDTFTNEQLRALAGVVLRVPGGANSVNLPVRVDAASPEPRLVVGDGVDVRALLRGDAPAVSGPTISPPETPVVEAC